MSYVQLIERVDLPASLWLTFWDMSAGEQVSLEIRNPSYSYDLGELFVLKPGETAERSALSRVLPTALPPGLVTLVPVPSASVSRAAPRSKPMGDVVGKVKDPAAARETGVLSFIA